MKGPLKGVKIHKKDCCMLKPGATYQVICEFWDYDGTLHPVSEQWTYLTCSFSPYNDGLQWFIRIEGAGVFSIPLSLSSSSQRYVVQYTHLYLKELRQFEI